MKINFFEGGRRLVILAQVISVCVAVVTVVQYKPYVQVVYEIFSPSGYYLLSKEQKCDDYKKDASETISRIAENGENINIILCFKGQEFSRTDKNGNLINKEFLIPYRVDDKGMIWGASKYSPEGSSYIEEKTKNFELPPDAYDKHNDIWWKKKIDDIKETAKILFFTLIGFSIFSFVLGWIIRGFFGINNGSDFRSKTVAPPQVSDDE